MFAGGAWLGAAPVTATAPVDRPDLPANVASKSLPLLDLGPSSASTVYYNVTLGVRGPLHTLHQQEHHVPGHLDPESGSSGEHAMLMPKDRNPRRCLGS